MKVLFKLALVLLVISSSAYAVKESGTCWISEDQAVKIKSFNKKAKQYEVSYFVRSGEAFRNDLLSKKDGTEMQKDIERTFNQKGKCFIDNRANEYVKKDLFAPPTEEELEEFGWEPLEDEKKLKEKKRIKKWKERWALYGEACRRGTKTLEDFNHFHMSLMDSILYSLSNKTYLKTRNSSNKYYVFENIPSIYRWKNGKKKTIDLNKQEHGYLFCLYSLVYPFYGTSPDKYKLIRETKTNLDQKSGELFIESYNNALARKLGKKFERNELVLMFEDQIEKKRRKFITEIKPPYTKLEKLYLDHIKTEERRARREKEFQSLNEEASQLIAEGRRKLRQEEEEEAERKALVRTFQNLAEKINGKIKDTNVKKQLNLGPYNVEPPEKILGETNALGNTNFQGSSTSSSQGSTHSIYNCGVKPSPPLGYKVGGCVNGKWNLISQKGSEALNCGLKPILGPGERLGPCSNGEWVIYSSKSSEILKCGLKPVPPIGYKIGKCVNGKWQFVSR